MKKKNLGLLFLLIPIFILVLVLVLYAVVTFAAMIPVGFLFTSKLGIVNFILGVLGIVALVSFIPGIIFGLKFLSQKDQAEIEKLKKYPEYHHLTEEQIFFITKVSWGCFFQTFVWCMGNKLYWRGVVSLLPFIGIYPWVELTLHGRRIAWEKGGWHDFEQFKKRQKTMAYIVLVVMVLSVISQASEVYFKVTEKMNFSNDKNMSSGRILISPSESGFSDEKLQSDSSSEYYCGLIKDTDSDGLFDVNETNYYATDPKNADSDGDSYSDFQEIRSGNNPNGAGAAERTYTSKEESSFYLRAKEKCSAVQ